MFQIFFGQSYARDPSNPINNRGLSRKHVIEGMEASLKRLDLLYVDVVFAHRPDRQTPMEEIVRAFNHLINTGKAFYWGTSEWTASEIADAWRIADRLGLIGPIAEQPQYNLLIRQRVEREYRWLYAAHGLGLTVFSPLRQGILTGKYNNMTAPPPGSRLAESQNSETVKLRKTYGGDAWQKEIATVEALNPIAKELNVSLAQLALAWVLKNPNVSTLIIGASRPAQIWENVQALAVVDKLTPEIIEKIESAVNNKPEVEPLRV
jgi:aryl-alcohol dehydrogenase-like predicted oxidoreductase